MSLAPGTGRIRAWAAVGLAALGDLDGARTIERELVARFAERRGDLVRLRIGDGAEEVSEATELFAVLAAAVGDPLAADALAYVTANLPWDDLPSLAQVTVLARLLERLPAAPASVVIVDGAARRTVAIPGGGATTSVLFAQRSAMRIEPASGSVSVTALWDDPAGSPADVGPPNPDLSLTRTSTPPSPIPANGIVKVTLVLTVSGPTRTGEVEVVDLLPSGLVALPEPAGWAAADATGYEVGPTRVEGQRVVFTVSFGDRDEVEGRPVVPGTFRLAYFARVVTPGTYAWQPAVAREVSAPGLASATPSGSVELR
jgi:hypothetical protein